MSSRPRQHIKLVVFALFVCKSLYAGFSLPESAQIHGFASLGYFNTSGNDFFGDTKSGGDVDFWELGINGSWRPLTSLQLSLQVVSRQAGETDDGDLRIDYGFLDYSILSDFENLWGVRFGRVVNTGGLYNDTRDMAFTRPSILLPQSIYFDVNRQFALSGDGGQVYGERRTSFGDFFLNLTVFQPRVNDQDLETGIEMIVGTAPLNLDGRLSLSERLLYEKDGGRLRLAISAGQAEVKYTPKGQGSTQGAGEFKFDPLILSAQYNAENWSLTAEYALRHNNFDKVGSTFNLPDSDFTGESFYIQGTYRFNPRWQAMVRYDQLIWDRDDRDGKEFEEFTGLPSHNRFAKDWTIGARWDITSKFMILAEYHRVNGTAWLSSLENDLSDTKQHWNLFAILAAYRF